MLFTLRLLPCTKRWPRRVIHLVLFVNFAITLAACICYGIRCTPMAAIWKSVPNAKCRSIAMFTTSQQVHGGLLQPYDGCRDSSKIVPLVLACIIDITTAAIPAFLLWDLKMKRSTKVVLDTIFALGLITAGLSIGRVVTTKNSTWQSDMTCKCCAPFSIVRRHLVRLIDSSRRQCHCQWVLFLRGRKARNFPCFMSSSSAVCNICSTQPHSNANG